MILSREAARLFQNCPDYVPDDQVAQVVWCGYEPQRGRPGMGVHRWKFMSHHALEIAVRFASKADAERSGVGAPALPHNPLDQLPGRGVAYLEVHDTGGSHGNEGKSG